MTVLITGGAGVIGSWVVRRLVEQGVRPVTYDLRGETTLIKDIVDKLDMVAGDVLDLPRILHTVAEYGVQRIIHTAAMLTPEAQANPHMAVKVNVEGTVNVLEAARITGVRRVVFTSSKGVYGNITGDQAHPTYTPVTEDHPKTPGTVYDATKLAAEHLGLNYWRDYGVDFIALRFAMTYGPGKTFRHSKVIPCRIIENAMMGEAISVPQGGDQADDMVYVKDIAQAVVLACYVENPQHRIFNVGTGKGLTLVELGEEVRKVFPKASIQIGPGLDYLGTGGSYYSILDISRARRELGYVPKYDLNAAVMDYVENVKRLGIALPRGS